MASVTDAAAQVIVCASSERALGDVRGRAQPGNSRWTYIGKSVEQARFVGRLLEAPDRRLELAAHLLTAAHSLRQTYIDYVGRLGRDSAAADSWSTAVSEKNPYVSQLFYRASAVRACHLVLGEGVLGSSTWVVVPESPALHAALVGNLRASGFNVTSVGGPKMSRGAGLRTAAEMALHRAKFVATELAALFWSRYVYRLHQTKALRRAVDAGAPITLVHTIIDNRSLDLEKGTLTNVDFEDLVEHMEARSAVCVTLPIVTKVFSFRKVARFLSGIGLPVLEKHAFLSPIDVLRTLLRTARERPKRRDYPLLDGIDVSELVWADEVDDWVSSRRASAWLYQAAIRRWRKAGIPVARYIYDFENQIWERVVCHALRASYPGVRIVSYQPSRVPLLSTNFFVSELDAEAVPLPDRIVASGPLTFELLRRHYGPRVVEGGALRQRTVLDRAGEVRVQPSPRHPVVLVTPSIGFDESLGLIEFAVEGLGGQQDVRVILKCHPGMPWQRLGSALPSGLPGNFTVSDRTVGEILAEEGPTSLVYTTSTTPLEAMAIGVPPVHMVPSLWLDFDPLEYVPELRPAVSTPDELRSCVQAIASDWDSYVAERSQGWKEAAARMFNPVGPETFDLFLD